MVHACAAYAAPIVLRWPVLRCGPPKGHKKESNSAKNHRSLSRREALHLALTSSALITSSKVSGAVYDRHAAYYELLDGSTALTRVLGFNAMRSDLLSGAQGAVVELGAGTGLNLDYYPPAVTDVTAVDESELMLRRAAARAANSDFRAPRFNAIIADAASTGLPSAAFDTVIATFVLCVVKDAAAVACEMRRLVAQHGTALVLDYSRSSLPIVSAYQDITASTVARWSKGCVPNIDLQVLLSDAGFRVVSTTSAFAGTVIAIRLSPC